MLPFESALERVLQDAMRLGTERVYLPAALSRVLAGDVISDQPLPPFDYSAMDGYALRHADLNGAGPWRLPVVGESRTGHEAPTLKTGTACRIFTGAQIPAGADCVELQENVTRTDDTIELTAAPAEHANIRRAGSDLQAAVVALQSGHRIGPWQLSLAAALERTQLVVARRPRVVVISTGDELRAPGEPGRPGSIPESNGVAIAALASSVGADATLAPLLGDDREQTISALKSGLDSCDVLVTIGGVSVGDHDLVRPGLEAAGVTLDFWKVAIKPGKPLVLGRRGQQRVLGLPGNPVSAQLTFLLFGLPLLRALQGEHNPGPIFSTATLTAGIKQRTGRRGFYRCWLEDGNATPLSNQSSGNVASMAQANSLAVVPEDQSEMLAGAQVQILKLS